MPEFLSAILLLILGGAVLISGGEIFIRGATGLAHLFRIPPLIIGLTIVAAATSAPEMAVSLIGILGKTPNPDIALGNVVGSNIANILLILGFTATLRPLAVSNSMVKREIPMMILFSILLWLFSFFTLRLNTAGLPVHALPLWGGIFFLLLLAVYNFIIVREASQERNKELAQQVSEETEIRTVVPKKGAGHIILAAAALAAGLGMLIGGSHLFVEEAKIIAKICGVSDLVISLTILAVGTSLPELAVSIISVIRGNVDIAVGNVMGSNIFNLLGILGVSAVAAGGLAVSNQALICDIPMMIGTAAIGGYFCITDKKLERWEGAFLLAAYIAYTIFLMKRGG